MTNAPTRNGSTPTDLITSSKTRFTLGRARLRREQYELALLSLHGSLEDGLRAHLTLHSSPAANGDWPALLAALLADPWQPLTPSEVERIGHMQRLHALVAQGDPVTLTAQSVNAYQHFVAALLARYGVLVVAPESAPPPERQAAAPRSAPAWRRYRTHLLPILIILAIFVVGAATTIVLQQSRERSPPVSIQTAVPTDAALVTMGAAPITTLTTAPALAPAAPTVAPPGALAPGRTAVVANTVGTGGLALRTQPGTAASIPVQIYLLAGTQVEVVGGPLEADGYTWWQVRAANQTGWCAGAFLEVR